MLLFSSSHLVLLSVVFVSSTYSQYVQSNTSSTLKGRTVDLGYSQYQGYIDSQTEKEFFLGIRFAEQPVRFQAPIRPKVNRTAVLQGNVYGAQCHQFSTSSNGSVGVSASSSGLVPTSEDCLFLNVWRPANSTNTNLPVIVQIHGGAYASGNGRNDPTFWQDITGTEFIFVSIQYRLGSFGFLASADVHEHGALNAGLLDQRLALQWVQEHIGSFNGDPYNVTIFGESAGGGSVMNHLLAYGGTLGSTLFRSAIAASPYLPKQYDYASAFTSNLYYSVLKNAGCSDDSSLARGAAFDCLTSLDADKFLTASQSVVNNTLFGTLGFAPVTDGVFLQGSPTRQLLERKVNGERAMVGYNTHDGLLFVPQNLQTRQDFLNYLSDLLPLFSNVSMAQVLKYYPEPAFSSGLYATQVERAATIYGDLTFLCPGQWIADAFSTSYRYQYAVGSAIHAIDLPHYLPQPPVLVYPSIDNNLSRVIDTAFTSFVMGGTPKLVNSTLDFPLWNGADYGRQLTFNTTNGVSFTLPIQGLNVSLSFGGDVALSVQSGGLTLNGNSRCDFWRSNSVLVPT
ncbi:Predicted protein [Taphrina deformans PYCC 5710]|uniref:Carboxylesterase type B domain-containing protein n=1 Tax=Taphrina deformans (strain PYCC 5710 / ATCC 11124 / CBS 356.35 / IMI 108563 / JCM 9778 / NBRC 8474) TaxID=1097556 RepID=R4XPL0_TAPDE|nr:Predicted protein [Taphrina deformans PYCC 5710]|eukprot:CCG85146.1 Predicted protein [Taphrina deformans PYCC 5710]